jgi:hypothetical protein
MYAERDDTDDDNDNDSDSDDNSNESNSAESNNGGNDNNDKDIGDKLLTMKQNVSDNAKAQRALVGPYMAKLTRDMTGKQARS